MRYTVQVLIAVLMTGCASLDEAVRKLPQTNTTIKPESYARYGPHCEKQGFSEKTAEWEACIRRQLERYGGS